MPLTIKRVPISSIYQDPANVRLHPEKNLAHIAASLRSFGQVEPLIVQSGTGKVIGGNGRLSVLVKSGATEVDIVEIDIDDTRAAALSIALNQSALSAEWDEDALTKMLESLPDDLLPDTGFDEKELDRMLSEMNGVVEDEVPEPLPEAVSVRGDVWLMGGHRLLCGDSTNGGDVAICLNGEKCDLCLTDPPYGCGEAYVSHNDTQENLGSLADRFFPLAIENCKVVAFTPGIQNIRHYPHADWMLCWFYGVGVGRTPWGFTCWQPVCVWGKDPKLANGLGCHPDGVNKLMTQDDAEQNRSTGHACPKPLSVWCWFLERLTNESGETVYEPFSGSGTTIIACEQLKRRCFAIEIEPRYVDVGVRRWQTLTGKEATLESSGRTFAEVKQERGK